MDGDRNNAIDEAESLLWDDPVTSWLNPAGDQDFYSFTAEAGDYVRITTATEYEDGNTVLVLRNAAGKVHAWVDDYPTGSGVSTFDSVLYAWLPEAGTWTISVQDAGSYYTGGDPVGDPDFTYELRLSIWSGHTSEEDAGDDPSYEITMDATNTWNAIGVALEEDGDTDHVKVILNLDDVELRIAGVVNIDDYDSGASPRVRLIDSDGVTRSDKSGLGPDGYAIYPFLERGTYRLELLDEDSHGGNGEWFFAFAYATDSSSQYVDESEPNDELGQAEEVELTETETDSGSLYSFGNRFGTADAAGDEDWFRLEVPYDGAHLIACLSSAWYGSLLTPDLEIYDDEGTLLASEPGDADTYPNATIDGLAVDSGTYYILVRAPETANGDVGEWYRFVTYAATFDPSSYACP